MKMENYIAKPDKTLLEHTKDVKEQLEVMKNRIYTKPKDILSYLPFL